MVLNIIGKAGFNPTCKIEQAFFVRSYKNNCHVSEANTGVTMGVMTLTGRNLQLEGHLGNRITFGDSYMNITRSVWIKT
jgi:hypothetical protein